MAPACRVLRCDHLARTLVIRLCSFLFTKEVALRCLRNGVLDSMLTNFWKLCHLIDLSHAHGLFSKGRHLSPPGTVIFIDGLQQVPDK